MTTELPWSDLRDQLTRFVGTRVPRVDADDVVQDALVRIHRGAAGVRDTERLSAWIYQVARNTIADHGRRARPVVAFDPDDPAAATPAGGDDVFDHDDAAFVALARCVRPFVDRLGSPYREAIAMVELDGSSQVEAAARLGVPLSTLKSRVQRGRAQLRKLLEECCAIELDLRRHVVGYASRCRPACATPGAA